MRKLLFIALLFLPSTAFASTIPWGHSLKQAEAEARRTHKLVMVDFYTSWCQYCKLLDANVYSNPQMIQKARQVVPVKLDAEHGGEAAAMHYQVQGFPTVLFLDSSGSPFGRITGYVDAPQFMQIMQHSLTSYHTLPLLQQRLRQHPSDTSTAARLVNIYAMQGNSTQALTALHSLLHADPHNHSGKVCSACFEMGRLYAQHNQFAKARPVFVRALQAAALPNDKLLAHMLIAICDASLHQKQAALSQLHTGIAMQNVNPGLHQQAEALQQQISRL